MIMIPQENNMERSKFPPTQGRKGHKQKRINMAYTPENYEFLHRKARMMGISMTEYMNLLIDAARREN